MAQFDDGLAVPLVLLLLFGYALTLDVDRILTVIYDQDQTPQSRELVQRFQGSRFFQIVPGPANYRTIVERIDDDSALLGVVIPNDFAHRVESGQEAKVQLLLDGSDSNTASIAAGYAEALIIAYSAELREKTLLRRGMGKLKMPVDARIRVLYNNELKSRNFIVPGLIAVILMIIAALLTSLTIAREWENGTMEQLLSTPVRPAELLLGKLAAYFVLGMADMIIALIVGVTVFDVPMRGSTLLLVGSSALFLLARSAGDSALRRHPLATAGVPAIAAQQLPAGLPAERLRLLHRQHAVGDPAGDPHHTGALFRHDSAGVFIKGTGLEVLWTEVMFLLIYAALVFTVAVRKMRQKMA